MKSENAPHHDLSRQPKIRVALVSDTHGELDERIAALVSDCDLAVHAGDVGDANVLDGLQANGAAVVAVRGNNDTRAKWPRSQHAVLARLAEQASVSLPGGLLVVVHGHRFDPVARRHDKLRTTFREARLIVYGHSHRRVCDRSARPWVINPGVAGRARTFGGPSCAILLASHNAWEITEHRFEKR